MNERNQQQRTPDTPAADKASPLSAREAAESLGVHERTIRRAIARGDLPATKRSGMWEIHGANLIDWSAKHSRSNHAIPAIQPLSTAPTTPPFRVPTPRTPLFGRVREVRNIVERIGDPRCALVTLTGPGGSGKTRLALAAAAETAGQFADGICFIDLSSLHDAGLVLPGIATALDLNAAAERSVYERLRAWLAPRTALLILDNVEHVTPAAIDLARLLEDCPGLTILTTSRVALKLSMEHQIPIPPLQLPPTMPECDLAVTGASPAVQLFIWRARTFDPSFALTTSNAKTIEEICRRLDGLPLAIELAAAHTRMLALPDLLDRLRLSMLSDGPANQPDRLRSLRQAIDWSYALLAPESQRAFRACAVFSDGFGPDAVAWVMGIDSDQALRELTTLMDHNLIVPVSSSGIQPRFSMLETIREFGRAMLDAMSEIDSVRRAHASWCIDLSKRTWPHWLTPTQAEWGNLVAAEHNNIRLALGTLAGDEDKAHAITLVGNLWPYWFIRSHAAEGLSWIHRALAWSHGNRTPERVRLLMGGSALEVSIGNEPEARRLAEEAQELFTELNMTSPDDDPINALAVMAAARGDRESANRLNDAALRTYRAHAQSVPMAACMVGVVLTNLAWSARIDGRLVDATSLAHEALALQRDLDHAWGLVDTLFLLALLAERRGDAPEATAFYRESLDLLLRDRDLIQVLGIIHQCARLLSGAGDHERVMLLIGAMDALRDRVSIPIHPRALAERAAWQQRATARLGADTCDQLSRRGRSSTLEETVAIARTAQVPSLHAGALSPWSLTPREQDVLALLVEGLTDQEIADRLFRSRRTINTHVANILAKMDVPGRRQAIHRARSSERVNS